MLLPRASDARSGPTAASFDAAVPDGLPPGCQSEAESARLIGEAQRGSRAAFDELVRRYGKAILRLAVQLAGSEHEAEDVYQDTLLSAYRNLPGFRFQCSFYTWMYRIVTNRCLDRLRRRKDRQEEGSATFPGCEHTNHLDGVADLRPDKNPEHHLETRELGASISRALDKLTPRERIVFELKHYQDLELSAVAAMLHSSEASTRQTLFRAKQKLRSALASLR